VDDEDLATNDQEDTRMSELIIIKYGELGLKGGNRPAFEAALHRNLEWALRKVTGARVKRERGRFIIHVPDAAKALPLVTRVFGVVGASIVNSAPLELERICAIADDVLQKGLAEIQGKTFKVETRRANKQFPLTTPELNSHIGAYLLDHTTATVDVHQPDVTVHVEIRDKMAYVYSATVKGPGGLPIGVASNGLLMISGGIDSPVAGWLAMRRGIALEAIHFHAAPYTSERSQQKVLDLMEILAAYSGNIKVHMVELTQAQLTLRNEAPLPLLVTLMRRIMFRVAERIALANSIPAIITGENVGQVASQTLQSMAVINAVTTLPIIRPLVTFDKSEIIHLAKRIGSYETSILPYEDCCTLFVPQHPETRPTLAMVEQAEASLDIAGMVQYCLEHTEIVTASPNPTATLYTGGPVLMS
jgi:thiamine biosynthesis protein ThiI